MLTIEFLRQFRVGGFAVFDFVAALLGIYLLSPLLSKLFLLFRLEIPRKNWIFLTLPMSIIVHLLIGNITPMTKNFLDVHGHYLLKIVIIILFILGLKGIKISKRKK